MKNSIYASPVRVYLLLGALGIAGLISGLTLPISLFPNSTKPSIYVSIGYGSSTAEEFLETYGTDIEQQLRGITMPSVALESINATYSTNSVDYEVIFKWGVNPDSALREVTNTLSAYGSRFPQDIRDTLGIYADNENAGFLAISFFSDTRSMDDIFDALDPLLSPLLTRIPDAQNPEIYNPTRREIRIELNAQALANLSLVPRDIESAVLRNLSTHGGGSLTIGPKTLSVLSPRGVNSFEEMAGISLSTPSGRIIHLSDVSKVDFGPKTTNSRSFKTSGAPSIIVYSTPKPGGNVKKMSEDIIAAVESIAPNLPKDISYKVLVDPSEFIRAAIQNVYHEVGIGALLAVLVLFLFIGSIKNVATAAIEIPLSMILAFLLMKLTGMNINLISLGGLALSAGMNVDASVVVMENIFRHFEEYKGELNKETRLRIVIEAVNEVRLAVIGSTIASLVVFIPLTFTSDLSYAILGDLAKAVVFSHGFSALVALLLVPTVRLHLMGSEPFRSHASPIEKYLSKLENWYSSAIAWFLTKPIIKWGSYGVLALLLVILSWLILPRLDKEVIGKPDTDWITLRVATDSNTILRQMEGDTEKVEQDLLKTFGNEILYTFTQVGNPNRGSIMSRLKDKRKMNDVWKEMEAHFANTPTLKFNIYPWNPSEMPIPDPADFDLEVRGGERDERQEVAKDLSDVIEGTRIYQRTNSNPTLEIEQRVVISPYPEQWTAIQAAGAHIYPSDLSDISRIALTGRRIAFLPVRGQDTGIVLRFPPNTVQSTEELGAFPIGLGSKILPLRALASVQLQKAPPLIYRKDGRELIEITGRLPMDQSKLSRVKLEELKKIVDHWNTERLSKPSAKTSVSPSFIDAGVDVTKAMNQLGWAVGSSILFIFFVMVFQFGSVAEPLLVLVAVPLGFIGVLISLYVFHSTLSLNSILGVILLNGIAVANSIILVDFIKRCVAAGMAPEEAALTAARKRLRPILITSLTTVLGMLPIALGFGDGGKILQPLGIAVAGGLWISMILTLFLVPALHVAYLRWHLARVKHS